MHTTATGNNAEKLVAAQLQQAGYVIRALNWRVKAAEIDIVAEKNSVMYFVEVKYRGSASQGDGLDYITPAKLHHMQRAASLWVHHSGWQGEIVLMAAAVDAHGEINLVEL